MDLSFEWSAPGRVIFGCGRLREAGVLIKEWGPRCLVFTGSRPERANVLCDSLRAAGCLVETLPVSGEPTFQFVRELVNRGHAMQPDSIAAIGGGSVIDAAKAVAMLMANGGDPLDYAEVVGRGLPVTKPSIPFVAIPTTAGAGAEATKNAVLIEPQKKAKVSLRSPLMIPRLVMIDPELTRSLPPDITAATGMDALSQLVESFVTVKSNPATDALCRAGIPRASKSLRKACDCPGDMEAREDMALAAWWSGMALANSGLGAVHGFAAALGGMCNAPHGLICSVMLPPVCRANIDALAASSNDQAIARYRELAVMLTGIAGARPADAVTWLEGLSRALPLEKLTAYGVGELDPDVVVEAAMRSSSMKGNPVALSREAAAKIFAAA